MFWAVCARAPAAASDFPRSALSTRMNRITPTATIGITTTKTKKAVSRCRKLIAARRRVPWPVKPFADRPGAPRATLGPRGAIAQLGERLQRQHATLWLPRVRWTLPSSRRLGVVVAAAKHPRGKLVVTCDLVVQAGDAVVDAAGVLRGCLGGLPCSDGAPARVVCADLRRSRRVVAGAG